MDLDAVTVRSSGRIADLIAMSGCVGGVFASLSYVDPLNAPPRPMFALTAAVLAFAFVYGRSHGMPFADSGNSSSNQT